MATNIYPVYGITPNVTSVKIGTTSAQVKSDGTSAGTGTDLMYLAFTAGANGSYVDKVKFFCVASAAATSSVQTTLRVYLSTVATPGATTAANTNLIGEVSAGVTVASGSISGTTPFEVPLGIAIKVGYYIHVSQHVAQTTNQNWQATVIGSDF